MTNCPKENNFFKNTELLYCTLPIVTWYHPVNCNSTTSFFNRLNTILCMHEDKILLHLFCLVIFSLFYHFWLFIKGLTLQWDSALVFKVQTLLQTVVTRTSASETIVSNKSDFYMLIWKRQSNLSKAINEMSPWIILRLKH